IRCSPRGSRRAIRSICSRSCNGARWRRTARAIWSTSDGARKRSLGARWYGRSTPTRPAPPAPDLGGETAFAARTHTRGRHEKGRPPFGRPASTESVGFPGRLGPEEVRALLAGLLFRRLRLFIDRLGTAVPKARKRFRGDLGLDRNSMISIILVQSFGFAGGGHDELVLAPHLAGFSVLAGQPHGVLFSHLSSVSRVVVRRGDPGPRRARTVNGTTSASSMPDAIESGRAGRGRASGSPLARRSRPCAGRRGPRSDCRPLSGSRLRSGNWRVPPDRALSLWSRPLP